MTPLYFRLMTETNYSDEITLQLLEQIIEAGIRTRIGTTEDDWIGALTRTTGAMYLGSDGGPISLVDWREGTATPEQIDLFVRRVVMEARIGSVFSAFDLQMEEERKERDKESKEARKKKAAEEREFKKFQRGQRKVGRRKEKATA